MFLQLGVSLRLNNYKVMVMVIFPKKLFLLEIYPINVNLVLHDIIIYVVIVSLTLTA